MTLLQKSSSIIIKRRWQHVIVQSKYFILFLRKSFHFKSTSLPTSLTREKIEKQNFRENVFSSKHRNRARREKRAKIIERGRKSRVEKTKEQESRFCHGNVFSLVKTVIIFLTIVRAGRCILKGRSFSLFPFSLPPSPPPPLLFSSLHFRVRNLHTRERIAGSGRTSGSGAVTARASLCACIRWKWSGPGH